MSDNDIFNKDKKPEGDKPKGNDDDKHIKQPGYDQLLGMIMNAEGDQKYNSVEEALKGANHANTHIAKLEQELLTLRDSQDSQPKLDDILKALQGDKIDDKSDDKTDSDSITTSAIQKMILETLKGQAQENTQTQNVTTVTSKFKELYGDKASETLYSKAETFGMNADAINDLIATNPKAALHLLGVDTKEKSPPNTDTGNLNSQNFEGKKEPEVSSSMGYVTSKQLEANWLDCKERTLAKLNKE